MTIRLAIGLALACGLTTLSSACGDDAANPEPPLVQNQAAYTNENPLTIVGTADPGAEVQIRGGAESVAVGQADRDGNFEVAVELQANSSNTLLLSQTRGGVESTATVFTIIHDDIAPDNPILDPVATPTRRKEITLKGSAELDSEILVTGGSVDIVGSVGAEGQFLVLAPIDTEVASITERELSVEARDLAGNVSSATSVSVVHNPALPIDAPMLDAFVSHTNLGQVLVTGTTESDLEIQMVGPDAVEVSADAEGAFSGMVTLVPNSSNTVTVFALVSVLGIASPPAQFSIIHDDIAPDAPTVFPLPSPTGASTLRVSGTSEAFASIEINGGASVATALADASGDFSVDVTLTADSINSLSIEATDRAGNASAVAQATVEQDSNLDEPVFVDAQPSPTSASIITLTGTAAAASDVEVLGGAVAVTVTSQADGSFSADVPLNPNVRNELHVRHVGGVTETLLIVDHDNVAPLAPNVDAIPSPTNKVNISVTGTSEPSARVSVTGGVDPATATADTAGRFAVPVTIPEDVTTSLLLLATDRAGNTSSAATASVTHSSTVPDAPVVDEQSPPPSSSLSHTVTGHITNPRPNITLSITGGSAAATGPSDAVTGAFSVQVALNANSVNSLEIRSLEGDVESPPSLVSIKHDDVAPGSVNTLLVSLGSPALSTCLARTEQIGVNGGVTSAEAFSTIRVLNSSAGAATTSTTTANSDGSFATTIVACQGDILRLRSIDAAGNSSAEVEVTVN